MGVRSKITRKSFFFNVSPRFSFIFLRLKVRRSCYDEGKRVSETLAFDYLRMQNVQIRVARIFNTYGPGQAFA